MWEHKDRDKTPTTGDVAIDKITIPRLQNDNNMNKPEQKKGKKETMKLVTNLKEAKDRYVRILSY